MNKFDINSLKDSNILTATPVSRGIITARVFVAESLEKAAGLQKGDILVTRVTDICWSPYFSLIGGLITEIGGLISHGAVIAREYGLPCLVGLENACAVLKTGEIVTMDASKGLIIRERDGETQSKETNNN